jgi:hypothetical protein
MALDTCLDTAKTVVCTLYAWLAAQHPYNTVVVMGIEMLCVCPHPCREPHSNVALQVSPGTNFQHAFILA